MLKIRALNRESSSDDDCSGIRKEAEEEIALDLYNDALRLQCNKMHDAAKDILYKLLNVNIPLLESQGGLPKTMSTIKYSCYVNIGNIASAQSKNEEALQNFLVAAELDKSDVTLWHRIGVLALSLNRFRQAAFAFVRGLDCSEAHWPCLDKLISVLYSLQDTISCLFYIGKALTLDTQYVKGVVLRKQIFLDYPGTDEYYKQYNPNHIYEPTVDYDATDEEKCHFLHEARLLTDRINQAEKLLEAKPLTTIPLPRALKDFTWLDLGRTVTALHQYLTDQNMTHLTKVDIKRCMSSHGGLEPELATDANRSPENDSSGVQKDVEVAEPITEVQEQESGEAVHRRPSQNSENDTDAAISAPDDNEEMEQETEDLPEQDGSNTPKTDQNRSLTKSAKRKRDLVSELQIWGWHSKRRSAKRAKTDKDYTIEDALTRIIPSHLMPNGLSNAKQIDYSATTSPMDPLTIQEIGKMREDDYFGSEGETRDVKEFWSRNWTNRDAIDLIEAFVYAVAHLWRKRWPADLAKVYVTAYTMLREHASHPELFCDEHDFKVLRRDAICTLLYGELVTHTSSRNYLEQEIHCSSVVHLTYISGWEDKWLEEYNEFAIRVHWMRAHLFKRKNENQMAIMALQLIQDIVNCSNLHMDTFKMIVPNNETHQIITKHVIEELLSKLQLIDSLSRVEELFEKQSYNEVAEIIKLTFNSSNAKVTYGKIGRQAQLGILLHSLWYSNQSECFIWAEECLHETVGHVLKPSPNREKWEMILEKCLLILVELIRSESVSIVDILEDSKRIRLVESLTTLCRKQVNTDSSRIPMAKLMPYFWILLHYILLREEHRQQAKKTVNHIASDAEKQEEMQSRLDDDDELPPSIAILFSAHEFLGPKSWCLANQGELLHFMLDSIIHRLDAPILEAHRDKIDIHLEQAFFCLYQHPCKKNKVSRHLADHNVNPLPLSWERAQQLYEYFCPDALPEFDSYKSISISADLEQLLQRICALIPKECDPQPLLPRINEFIHNSGSSLPKPLEFPPRIKAVYYLLGDYYFKQSEVKRSYKYFMLDLCINPNRIDTWAGLALGIHSQLESKLNHCERFKNELEFVEKAKSAKICFLEALKLNKAHVTLWIEFGSFEYMVHAFCSRVLKYESEMLSMEKFEALEAEKNSYLESSRRSFQQALALYEVDQGDADERWLFNYMIAKICEKKQEDPKVFMQHYMQAANLLHENNCQYPEKINYNNPQHLSLEALEVHYRMNASILKYLEAHDGKPIPIAIGKLFKKCLDHSIIQKSKYDCSKSGNKNEAIKGEPKDSENVVDDVQKLIDDLIKKVEENEGGGNLEDVVIIDAAYPSLPKIKVRNIQDIMDDVIKESLNKSKSSLEYKNVQGNFADIDEPPVKSGDEKSERGDGRETSEDETNIRKSTTTATEDSTSSSSSSSTSSSSESESEESSTSTSTDSANGTLNLCESEVLALVDRCIVGLEHCIRRLPQNYKALYRLAHVYYSYSKKKDMLKSKDLLLGEYKCRNSVLVNGLFADRKTSNFFNGIWRIPSSEIDRPGSLSAHMSRCVTLLLQVLRDTKDHKTLLDLCFQLRRVPDPDKVYIRHSEREQLSEDAMKMCLQTVRQLIKEMDTKPPQESEKLIVDIFRAYQRSQKNLPQQEKVFAGLLSDAYKKLMGERLGSNSNVLDLAIKFSQQTRVAEKLKKQISCATIKNVVIPPTPAVPPIAQPPPSAINIPASIQPIKRPNLGRPRGRPPGPAKPINPLRAPRGRGIHTSTFPWSNSMFSSTPAYDFFKYYQDEIMRQYNSSTLGQFGNLFGGTLPIPVTTTAAAAATANLLSSAQNVSATSAMYNASLLQQAQQLTLSPFNPNMVKQVIDSFTVSNTSPGLTALSSDKLTQLNNFGQGSQPSKGHKTSGSSGSKPKKTTSLPTIPALPKMVPPFKYPMNEAKGKATKTKISTTLYKDIPHAHSSTGITIDKSKALMKDRPGISITPILIGPTSGPSNAPHASSSPSTSSPGKTLQEKLADKQKQQKQAAKSLDFTTVTSLPATSTASSAAVVAAPKVNFSMFPGGGDFASFQNVIPNYLFESGLSISQVQQKMKQTTPANKPKGMSQGLQKKQDRPSEKKSNTPSDDDVIIIE